MAEKPHDVVVKFDTYGNLQRHRAVLPAITRLSCTAVTAHDDGIFETLRHHLLIYQRKKNADLDLICLQWFIVFVDCSVK